MLRFGSPQSRTPGRTFGPDYREQALLSDGTRALVRAVRGDDKPLFAQGFERLSPRSRYLRFLGAKKGLDEADLRHLTEVDHEHHVALVALVEGSGCPAERIAVGRFVRDPCRPAVAEVAITVLDAVQGRGLGALLTDRLRQAATERGVDTFRWEVLEDNVAMRRLIARRFPSATVEREGAVLCFEAPVDDPLRHTDPARETGAAAAAAPRLPTTLGWDLLGATCPATWAALQWSGGLARAAARGWHFRS
jgi:GNAT superfamily N-acetyltransferase